ncbi:4Fe-4S double cluster binding domain-containing protein [Calderihabitans maritimus]|uniref:4Fe-4S ferredoxin iron-sulfur binding domain protein n=1 Tax=Calderihabitans maritimus TaxID=1246530 RepID=A0A1Z5HWJ3_9FIRM|nr:4Fe-4S double cluster binding domain-containing protein [Calderihabitans maritimus]GAW93701.1 4Fe-4S ferredoxin iron-sulfur binding domain protein [Calderihabitans maritimus]
MEAKELKEKLKELAKRWGADLFGVADLTPARDYIERIYGEEYAAYPRAVVMAVFFPAAVVDQLAEGPTHTYLYYYKVINTRLDDIALRVSNFLQEQGYATFPVPASQRVTEDKLAGIFSHRLAANRAGLGWIGKSGSLVNPQVGPRLRLVTVLTDAPLPADQPIEAKCGECRACVEACPVEAIKGVVFNPGDPLEARLAVKLCDEYQSKVRVSFGKRVCGRCLAACPWGKSSKARSQRRSD